jgi:hypothetical protein
MRKPPVISALVCATFSLAFADVKLPAIFSDHMVVQRGRNIPVWGWADPGEDVTVSVAGQTKHTRAGADGRWLVRLSGLTSKAPFEISVKGRNALTVRDALAGEVWLCSGQSNMALRVSSAQNFEQERAAADWPQIRMFTVESNFAKEPQADCKGKWVGTASVSKPISAFESKPLRLCNREYTLGWKYVSLSRGEKDIFSEGLL